MSTLHPAIWDGIMTTVLVLLSQRIHSSLVSSKHPSLQPPSLSQFLLCSHTSNQNVPGNCASAWRGDASEPGQMHLISQSGRLSSAPPTRMWMLASTGRDKCGQSQAITGRTEEASELMTGRERSGEILSAWRPSGSRGDKCFSRQPQVQANSTHDSLPLLFTPLSGSPQGATHHLSKCIYHTAAI